MTRDNERDSTPLPGRFEHSERTSRISIAENEITALRGRVRALEVSLEREQAALTHIAHRQIELIGVSGNNGRVGALRADLVKVMDTLRDHNHRITANERIGWKISIASGTGAGVGLLLWQLFRQIVGG